MFVFAIILGVLALAALAAAFFVPKRDSYGDISPFPRMAKLVSAGLGLLALVFLAATMVYAQDPGEAKVLKNWSGSVEGQDTTEGFALKAPWVDAIDYDIRNQQAAYIGNGQDDFNGKKPNGPQITIQDKDGVSANFDVAVRYSIRPDKVSDVYREFGVQENFRARLIDQDIRSVVRNAPAKYSTLDVLTRRGDVEKAITAALAERWEAQGVQVESVALQEIRYPDDVRQKYADAQNARTEIVKAQAELEAAQISAQQKVVQAQAEADANSKLAASLTDPILRQRYLDTLKELAKAGNLVVVPADSGNQIINLPAK
ncbi:SPFH domain-containing protein [Paenarthrobacter nitroguajacolicus]|uniref:SPFH domain-containing protein n=1 Tax=Paenarthrobacter nitroguajacolicus TaxID=211146 RepID=UPI0015C09F6B|nr:SPFH domain-containing protein [Paenarthrobacter nitroguajacolicus]